MWCFWNITALDEKVSLEVRDLYLRGTCYLTEMNTSFQNVHDYVNSYPTPQMLQHCDLQSLKNFLMIQAGTLWACFDVFSSQTLRVKKISLKKNNNGL